MKKLNLKQDEYVKYKGKIYGINNPCCRVCGKVDGGDLEEFLGDQYILTIENDFEFDDIYPYSHFLTFECNLEKIED